MRLAIDPASIAPPAVSPVAIRRAAERQQATIAQALRARAALDAASRPQKKRTVPAPLPEPAEPPAEAPMPQPAPPAKIRQEIPGKVRLVDIVTAVLAVVNKATPPAEQITRDDLASEKRKRPICRARFAVSMIAKRHTNRSLSQIAEVMGKRDHTTIRSAILRGFRLEETDPDFAALVRQACEILELPSEGGSHAGAGE